MKPGLHKVVDKTVRLHKAIDYLTSHHVLVGVPADEAPRDEGENINNAELAYIHEHGAPEVDIPARPFMAPTIKARCGEIKDELRVAGELALAGKPDAVERQLHRIGLRTSQAIQAYIRAGIPPPLEPATIAKRRIRSKGSKYRRKAVTASQVVPLIDTAQMLRSITYVVRKVS
jgi:hypothetical protein